MLNDKIKGFIKTRKLKNIDYAKSLNLSNAQALNTKFLRNSFKIQDIINLAELANSELAILDKETKEVIVVFNKEDLKIEE